MEAAEKLKALKGKKRTTGAAGQDDVSKQLPLTSAGGRASHRMQHTVCQLHAI